MCSNEEIKDGKKAMLSGQVFSTAEEALIVDEAPNTDALRTSEYVAYQTRRKCSREGF